MVRKFSMLLLFALSVILSSFFVIACPESDDEAPANAQESETVQDDQVMQEKKDENEIK